jgi:hypothetical protein
MTHSFPRQSKLDCNMGDKISWHGTVPFLGDLFVTDEVIMTSPRTSPAPELPCSISMRQLLEVLRLSRLIYRYSNKLMLVSKLHLMASRYHGGLVAAIHHSAVARTTTGDIKVNSRWPVASFLSPGFTLTSYGHACQKDFRLIRLSCRLPGHRTYVLRTTFSLHSLTAMVPENKLQYVEG